VDHALPMRLFERAAHLHHDVHRARGLQHALGARDLARFLPSRYSITM
jgi:hypothetical protein